MGVKGLEDPLAIENAVVVKPTMVIEVTGEVMTVEHNLDSLYSAMEFLITAQRNLIHQLREKEKKDGSRIIIPDNMVKA